MKCVHGDSDTHMQKHMHTHNKVPECSVYIIVFEMVMHEPVNQLATDKRAGHVPNNTHTHICTRGHLRTKLHPFCSDLISSNTGCSLMFSLFGPFY